MLVEGQFPTTLEHLVLTCLDFAFVQVHDRAAVELLEHTLGIALDGGSTPFANLRRVDFRIHEHALDKKKLVSKVEDGVAIYYANSSKCMAKTSQVCHALGLEFKVDTFLDFLEVPNTAT